MSMGGLVVKVLPGILGALLVCLGCALVSVPGALIVAGLFLLALDRRIT